RPLRVDGHAAPGRAIRVRPAARAGLSGSAFALRLTTLIDAYSRSAIGVARARRESGGAGNDFAQVGVTRDLAVEPGQAPALRITRDVARRKRITLALHGRARSSAARGRKDQCESRARVVGRRRNGTGFPARAGFAARSGVSGRAALSTRAR